MAAVIHIQFRPFRFICTLLCQAIDGRSKWLDQIIDEIERVGAGFVMNAERRKQT